MFGNGRCCLSDSRYQELFVVPRVCGYILNSRHMALRRNLLFIYFASGNDPGRVLDPLWHSRGRAGRLLIAHWIASCRGYVWCIGLIGRHRTACERQSDIPEIGVLRGQICTVFADLSTFLQLFCTETDAALLLRRMHG